MIPFGSSACLIARMTADGGGTLALLGPFPRVVDCELYVSLDESRTTNRPVDHEHLLELAAHGRRVILVAAEIGPGLASRWLAGAS